MKNFSYSSIIFSKNLNSNKFFPMYGTYFYEEYVSKMKGGNYFQLENFAKIRCA